MTLPPALGHRNFRLFWAGNLLSLLGTLAQDAGRGWLVRELTPDAFVVSAVAACATIPHLFLALYAGAVADRVDKRRGLMLTNSLALCLGALFFVLVWARWIEVWQVAVLSLLLGCVSAFDVPIRQSMNVEMVGRHDLPNAIALNSTAFNGARALGPAFGGFVIHNFGLAFCFLFNAFSYLPLLWNLRRMKLAPYLGERRAPGLTQIREGFDHVRAHVVIGPIVILVGLVSALALSYNNLMPIFARDVLGTDARGFAALLTSAGVGALLSAAKLALRGSKRTSSARLWGGAFALCLSVIGLSFAPSLVLACAFQALGGYCLLTFLTSANTLVQTLSPDELRGRIFSLYSLALIGATPVGAFWIGAMASLPALGPRGAIAISAGLALIALLWAFARRPDLRVLS